MRDLYEIIGVPETASDVWIERAYKEARARVEARDTTRDNTAQKQKLAELASLDEAMQTLSSADLRAAYDEKLEQWREAKAAGGALKRVKQGVLGLAVLAMLGGGIYWYQEREAERLRFEQEKIASEIAIKKKLAEIAEQRKQSEERLQREALERQQEEEKRLELAREQRAQDSQSQRFVVDDRYEKAQREKRTDAERLQRQNDELRQRFETERIRNQAQVELDRQRRFIEQREREEAMAVQERAAAARARPQDPK
jgi:hypothetical protein